MTGHIRNPEKSDAYCMDLIAYLERATRLEMAIKLQKQLIDLFENFYKDLKPVAPKKQSVDDPPNPPEEPTKPIMKEPRKQPKRFTVGVVFVAIGSIFYFHTIEKGSLALVFVGLVFWIFGGAALLANMFADADQEAYRREEQRYQSDMDEYQLELSRYHTEVQRYATAVEQIEDQYQSEMEQYLPEKERFDVEYERVVGRQHRLLQLLESSLKKHYDANVLQEKYRNWKAVGAIAEYFRRGSCVSLTGYDGAYALFDIDLKSGGASCFVPAEIELAMGSARINMIYTEFRERVTNTELEKYYAETLALIGKENRYEFAVQQKTPTETLIETPKC